MMGDVPDRDVTDAVRELDAVRHEWLSRPGVTGVDVGLRRGADAAAVAIRVYVAPDRPAAEGAPFPDRLGRFPVEVIEATFGPQ